MLALLFVAALLTARASAQDRALHWERYDVGVEVEEDGDLLFAETHVLVIDSGSFTNGSRSFDTGEFGRVRDVQVSEDGAAYRPGTDEPGTFTSNDDGERFSLRYFFRDPTATRHEILIRYTVAEALVDDGDQARLEWNFFCGSEGCPRANAGSVTVQLPEAVASDALVASTSGVPVRSSQTGDTLRWETTDAVQAEQLQLSVAFPRSILAPDAAFRSDNPPQGQGQPAPAVPRAEEAEPAPALPSNPAPATGGFSLGTFLCLAVILFVVVIPLLRRTTRPQAWGGGQPFRPTPWGMGGFGAPRRRRGFGRRRRMGGWGWGIPPIIIPPPNSPGDSFGGPFTTPQDDPNPGGGGSFWGNPGGGGSSWGNSGGGGSSWGDSGGGGSSWGDSGGGGSSWGGGGDSGGGGGNDSSSFG